MLISDAQKKILKSKCPWCRRDLIIADFIIKNNALNLLDLNIHGRFIPIVKGMRIKTLSIDDDGWENIIETKIIPPVYDDKMIQLASKNKKIQKALLSNNDLLLGINEVTKKYIFLKRNMREFYGPPLKQLKYVPVNYLPQPHIISLSAEIFYYDYNKKIPLYPRTKLFIMEYIKKFIIKYNVNIIYNEKFNFRYCLRYYKKEIRSAQEIQARRIGFQKKRDEELKNKQLKDNSITRNKYPPHKKIHVGDIHITPEGDKGICVGFNLWKYISGKILIYKKRKWIISDRVCTLEEIPKRLQQKLMATS
jgi:hypothetical protein